MLALTNKGLAYEKELELEAARQSFASAVDLDPEWKPAVEGLARVKETIRPVSVPGRRLSRTRRNPMAMIENAVST